MKITIILALTCSIGVVDTIIKMHILKMSTAPGCEKGARLAQT
jgi:hypothetical protein